MIEIVKEISHEKVYIEDLSGEKTLLALLQEHGIAISAPCNGRGECGKCRIRFLAGAPMPTEKERKLLSVDELEKGIRLACAVHVKESCRILILESGEEEMAVLKNFKVQAGSPVTGQNLYAQAYTENCERAYGIAIDIGTTTLAAELFDLTDGRTLAVASGVNHQRAYGADVITRIAAANEGRGGLLRESICEDVARLVNELAEMAQEEAHDTGVLNRVLKIAVVGNTTMCHLLRGISCAGLGHAPFTPTDNTWYETDAGTLFGIQNCPAEVTILPGISAFVGADIVAGIYASGIDTKAGINLLLDIGTNGEMVLSRDGNMLVTSTAAGPVFEGGNISCGMPGIPGAICHIMWQPTENVWHYETIGNQPPAGICGTGIIDLTSAFMEAGYMDENGTLEEPWFTDGVAVAKEAIRFEQSDIREVQMGKAAVRAGIEILLAEEEEPEKLAVYLAGGFGNFIDVENAIRIGMFPEQFREHISSIGNSALKGAKQYLQEEESARRRIDRMIGRATERNLAEHPSFEELYFSYMSFK